MPASTFLNGLARGPLGAIYELGAAPTHFVNGWPVSDFGQVCTNRGDDVADYSNGLPMTLGGRLAVTFGGIITGYSRGLPFNASGKLVIGVDPPLTYVNGIGLNGSGQIPTNLGSPTILGPELVPDPQFNRWTVPEVPDGWDLNVSPEFDSYYEQGKPIGLRHFSDTGVILDINVIGFPLVAGRNYHIQYRYSDITEGFLQFIGGFAGVLLGPVGKTKILELTATTPSLAMRRDGSGIDATLSYLSVRELITAP